MVTEWLWWMNHSQSHEDEQYVPSCRLFFFGKNAKRKEELGFCLHSCKLIDGSAASQYLSIDLIMRQQTKKSNNIIDSSDSTVSQYYFSNNYKYFLDVIGYNSVCIKVFHHSASADPFSLHPYVACVVDLLRRQVAAVPGAIKVKWEAIMGPRFVING